ncbi:hypothetical protein NFI96_023243, partial [Prochilodus magdalenae]
MAYSCHQRAYLEPELWELVLRRRSGQAQFCNLILVDSITSVAVLCCSLSNQRMEKVTSEQRLTTGTIISLLLQVQSFIYYYRYNNFSLITDEFKLFGPYERSSQSGSVVTLFCHLSPELSAVDMEIRWFKGTACVCLYKNRQVTEGRGYEGRVSLFTQELQRGNVSLQIRDRKESDTGDYLCQVTNGDITEECSIRVLEGLVSQRDNKWTEEERTKMKQSVQMTDLPQLIRRLNDKDSLLTERTNQLIDKDKQIQEKERQLTQKDKALQMKEEVLREKEALLEDTVKEVDSTKKQLDTQRKELQDKSSKLQEMMILLEQQKTELREKDKQLEEKKKLLRERNTQLMEREKQVEEKDRLLEERNKQLQERTDSDSSVPVRRRNSRDWNPPDLSGESCSTASPVSVPVAELRLVLLGRTGCEKSAAGNTILGREERSQAGASTVRQQSESRQGEVAGRQVTVVDTPDWFCPGLSLEELRQDVGLCVRLSAPGPHVFLLVIPVKQSTGEERGMLEKMEEIFGERCWRNTMILFTVTDKVQEKNIEEFIQSGNQEIQRLVEKCGNRFHCLNIKESGDGSQTTELLEKVGSREKFYSSEIYLEIDSHIREIEKIIEREREEVREIKEREATEKLERSVEEITVKFKELKDKLYIQINKYEVRIIQLERQLEEEPDNQKKVELNRQLEREIKKREMFELELMMVKEEAEKERKEMEEKHRQEMEEIRETYEGEAMLEAQRILMHNIMPTLHKKLLTSRTKEQEEFRWQMEETDRKMQTLINK